jgi:hypothetical protein
MNLIEDDSLWYRTLKEASAEYGQKYLIDLFCYILVYNEVGDPPSLYKSFKHEFMV